MASLVSRYLSPVGLLYTRFTSGQGGNIQPSGLDNKLIYGGIAIAVFTGIYLTRTLTRKDAEGRTNVLKSFLAFFWSSFIKPHQGDAKNNQQDALESFYKTQAGAYDATRKYLLRGREDMLGLVASQLQAKGNLSPERKGKHSLIWVDVS